MDPNQPRRCQSRSNGGLQCEYMVTEYTVHDGGHQAVGLDGLMYHWVDMASDDKGCGCPPGAHTLTGNCPPSARGVQVGGSHYRRSIQVWDVVEVWELDYFRGSVLKYLLRAGRKGPALEDLKKARHTLDKAIELEERKGGR